MAVNRILAHAREEAETPRSLFGFRWIKVLATLCLVAAVGYVVAFQIRTGLMTERPDTATITTEVGNSQAGPLN